MQNLVKPHMLVSGSLPWKTRWSLWFPIKHGTN